jgi:hypothetical protein
MQDPIPENIEGRKVKRHEFSHVVNWGYVAVGVGVLALSWVLYRALIDEQDRETTGPAGDPTEEATDGFVLEWSPEVVE